LVDYALDQVGEALRTVTVLYEDDCSIVFLRDDLEASYDLEQYERVAASFRTDLGVEEHLSGESPVGRKRALVHYHDRAYVFQFPHEDCHSILLSVDPTVGTQLSSFITECRQFI
jgi:hypothetical protein